MKIWNHFFACVVLLVLANPAFGAARPTHTVVLVDLSPSMKPHRAVQLEAVKGIIEKWGQQPDQTVDIFGVDGNPMGGGPLGHIDRFPYDPASSNPVRYRVEGAALQKRHLGTVLPAIERAMAAEDAKNKRNPELSQTCLVDALEVAARAFRRTDSQARQIVVISDAYEDCSQSVHLPREKLNKPKTEVLLRSLQAQGRIPQFRAPTQVRFVGMRLGSSPRLLDDQVEQFWIALLSRCGAEIKTDDFTPTWQGGN